MSDSSIRPGSDEEWEALLHQLRQQPKAQPQPFFYTRLQARLAADTLSKNLWLPAWARRPAYVAVLALLGLAVSGDDVAMRPLTAGQPPAGYSPTPPAAPLPR